MLLCVLISVHDRLRLKWMGQLVPFQISQDGVGGHDQNKHGRVKSDET